jgi:hypothetical protein
MFSLCSSLWLQALLEIGDAKALLDALHAKGEAGLIQVQTGFSLHHEIRELGGLQTTSLRCGAVRMLGLLRCS